MCRLLASWLLALPLFFAALGLAAEAPTILGAEDPVILVFGDSLSAGYGLPQGDLIRAGTLKPVEGGGR